MVLRYLSIFLLSTVVVGCKNTSNSTLNDPNYIANGEELYKQNCIACHGGDGTLGKAGSKNLKESTLSYEEVFTMVEMGGGNGMPRFKEILGHSGEIDAVVEYVMQMRGQ